MENITASEIAGLGVGSLLLCATIAAPKIDSFISSSQRTSLGMCKRCGDLKMMACSKCKGSGSVQPGGLFGFSNPINDLFSGRVGSGQGRVSCGSCNGTGYFPCPLCSKSNPNPPSSSPTL